MLMEYLQSYGLCVLELTFVLVALMLLHSLKHVIGTASFYLAMGVVMGFAQFVNAAGLNVAPSGSVSGLAVSLGSSILFAPFMAAVLIVYIVDGTLEAQRLIWGMMVLAGVFVYLAFLAEKQVFLPGHTLALPRDFFATMMQGGRTFMLASLLSLLVEFLALPMAYEILRSRNCRLWFSVFGAFMTSAVLDTFFFELVTNYGADNWWDALRQSYLARGGSMVWLTFLTVVYLHLRDAPMGHASSARRPMDIIIAFLGAYGQAQRLQANLREWEGRYRMVVENTNDLIFILSESGDILDANRRAQKISGYSLNELLHQNFLSLVKQGPDWDQSRARLFPDGESTRASVSDTQTHLVVSECLLPTKGGAELVLEAAITPISLQQSHGALVVARDITHRKALEAEREALQTRLMHSQRIEAVGTLAGGIAHDFNNLLHAIQGSLDNLTRLLGPAREPVQSHLDNIGAASERAAKLIGQLLGFARAGKYEITRVNLHDLLAETEGLFRAALGRKVQFRVVTHPDPMYVMGDFTQLEQVVFNMLLNARDALPTAEGRIVLRAEPAAEFTPGWDAARAKGPPGGYVVIRVKDNGSGIEPHIRKRIFEPFFTTKQAKGTGMGLAMAYGCVESHRGWIHLESEVNKGSEFFVFLPRA